MALLFQSYLQPFHVHHQVFSMFTGLGAVGMFGVVVNDSLVVIGAINRVKEKKG